MNYHVLEKARTALDHYLYLITNEAHQITVGIEPSGFTVADPEQDDAYRIDVRAGEGIITASNPRAAHIAVYHLLRENGCTFVRPGKASERISRKKISEISTQIEVIAAHRFRGLCIEGSCNLEDTLELLEWMPKVGMNCYFMQFREGYNFFQRWYECETNMEMLPWEFNLDVCRSIVPQIICTAHENGLMYHAVGHGFTCECFGVTALGWIAVDQWPEQYANVLAMRNGVRNMAENIPLISALCYSNPEVQQMVIDNAVNYIAEHPEYDYIHFWLDDGNNNKCECENCRDTHLAEYYIQMLNRLDKRLTEKHLNTKIVFLSYHELLWPPEKEKIINPERFTFMFAPIQRSFQNTLFCDVHPEEMKPYMLNNQSFPENNNQMAAHLEAWGSYLSGVGFHTEASFDFDYYCNDFDDPGQFSQARILYEDIRGLKGSGLNGLINCQAQRSFFSAALPMYVMARALLQSDLEFDRIVNEFFYGAFGKGWLPYRKIWEHLSNVSEVLRNPELSNFSELEHALRQPLPYEECKDLTTSHSRKLMRFSMELYLQLADMVRQARLGNQNNAMRIRHYIDKVTSLRECEFSLEFDRKYFSEAADRLIQLKNS